MVFVFKLFILRHNTQNKAVGTMDKCYKEKIIIENISASARFKFSGRPTITKSCKF